MEKKTCLSAIIFFLLVCLNIQTTRAQKLDWVRTADSFAKQGAMIARDANDNVVSCGYLIHDRMFTRKWDKSGNFLWEKESVSGIFNYRERPTWITTDNSNNIITLGYRYYGTSDKQPNAIVILKYAPDGTLLFKKTIEGVFGPSLRCELDPTGNIYIGVAATITGQSDFGFNLIKLDPNGNILFISIHNFGSYYSVNNMRYRNGYIALTGYTSLQGYSFNCTTALFNANGNYLWGVVSNILYAGVDVEVDNNGNVYVVNLDYTSGRNGDIQVTKYSVTGAVLFTYFYDKNGNAESPSRINLQPDGNVVISGVGTSPTTGLETFKLSSTGSLMWEAFYSAPYPDIPQLNFMATNPVTSDVFLTGTTSISGNPASIFTLKYDSFGNQSWVAKYDSTATRGTGLAIASDGSVFVVGLNWWTVLHYLNSNVPNPCSIPANLTSTGITSTAATFSWLAVPGAASYNLRYRVVGTTAWTTGTTATATFNAAGLTANTNYEWQVQTVCSGGNSSFTPSATFKTATVAACNAPTGMTTANITSSSAILSWSAVSGAASYNVQYRVAGSTTWTTGTTTANSFNAAGLTANSNYEWQVQTVCSGGNSSFTPSFAFTTIAAACSNIALGKTATASSSYGNNKPNLAVDGNTSTYWRSSSSGSSTQYLQLDFGSSAFNYSKVTIRWQSTRYARSFQIRVSNNASFSSYTTVYSTTTGSGGNQTISLSGAPRTERYIRLYMTKENYSYYAVNEFEVCGFQSSALKKQNIGDLVATETAIPKESECKVVIPNGFSPDGDGINDYFKVTCIENYPDAKLIVFNSAGQQVFQKLQFGNVDYWGYEQDAWWDGNDNVRNAGTKLPSGTYIYVLELAKGDKSLVKKGTVYISYK